MLLEKIVNTKEGVRHKPPHCKLCKLAYSSSGFCPDYSPDKPKIMLLLEQPFSSDVINQSPLSGRMGDWFEWKVLKPLGLLRKHLLISNVLRCKAEDYPSQSVKSCAENTCRFYDTDIKRFDPELFVYTYGLMDTFADPAFLALMIEDFKKGIRFMEQGERVCILMGTNAIKMIDKVPFKVGKGGLKSWRGNFQYTKWPYGN